MAYELKVSKKTEEQIEKCIAYLSQTLNNPKAASDILNEIDSAYGVLQAIPKFFPYCSSVYLKAKGFRRFKLQHHDYLIIFKVIGSTVYIVGFSMSERITEISCNHQNQQKNQQIQQNPLSVCRTDSRIS